MIDYKTEQILVIITTVLSLITAGMWSEVLESIFESYFEDKLKYKMVFAVILSVLTIYLIDWLVTNAEIVPDKETLKQTKMSKMSNYVRNALG